MQLRGAYPPHPPPHKNHDYSIILSCPQEKRNKTRKNKNRLAHRPISKKHPRYAPHHPPPSTPTLLHKNLHLCKAQTSRHEHILRVMPPRRTRQPPTHNLSWFSTPRRQAVLHQVHGLIDKRDRRVRLRLERFCHHIRAHDIPYLCASHQVYVQGPHSRQYFRTSLRLLLTLDYVPRKVKIPVHHLPYDCQFCPEITRHIFQHRRPFDYVIATRRLRGRPRHQDTTEESDSSESGSDDSDSSTDDDSSDTRTSTHNKSLPPPPESPPSQNHAPTTRRIVPSLPRNHQLHPRQW